MADVNDTKPAHTIYDEKCTCCQPAPSAEMTDQEARFMSGVATMIMTSVLGLRVPPLCLRHASIMQATIVQMGRIVEALPGGGVEPVTAEQVLDTIRRMREERAAKRD